MRDQKFYDWWKTLDSVDKAVYDVFRSLIQMEKWWDLEKARKDLAKKKGEAFAKKMLYEAAKAEGKIPADSAFQA